VGQVVVVVDALEPGARGSVRAADSLWAAEGCSAPTGARVRVIGVKGTVLAVEPA
jgi:membrane protein implicated in regulation of membrane protease activity